MYVKSIVFENFPLIWRVELAHANAFAFILSPLENHLRGPYIALCLICKSFIRNIAVSAVYHWTDFALWFLKVGCRLPSTFFFITYHPKELDVAVHKVSTNAEKKQHRTT